MRCGGVLLRVNLLFLALIAFLPYPTEVIGRYPACTSSVIPNASFVAACSRGPAVRRAPAPERRNPKAPEEQRRPRLLQLSRMTSASEANGCGAPGTVYPKAAFSAAAAFGA